MSRRETMIAFSLGLKPRSSLSNILEIRLYIETNRYTGQVTLHPATPLLLMLASWIPPAVERLCK